MPRMSATLLSRIRLIALAATGLVCLAYGVSAMILGRPDPFPSWIPVAFGGGSALLIFLSAFAAGNRNAEIATDELYFAESHRAQIFGFWVALMMYPVFGVALGSGWIAYPVAFAAMGTLSAAAFLLSFSILNARGGV